MRKLIVLTALFFSCGNKKAEIVELIKAYKDSCNLIDERTASMEQDQKRRFNEIFHVSGGTGVEKKISDLQSMNDTVNNRVYMNYLIENSIKRDSLKARKKYFMQKIDSLELELKTK